MVSHTTGTWGVIVGEESRPGWADGLPPFPSTACYIAPCILHAPRRDGVAANIADQSGKVYAEYKFDRKNE